MFLNLDITDWGQISPHASISNIKNFKHFSCLCPVPPYFLLHLLQLRRSPSWSFPCPLCSSTPPTGSSPSRRDGFLQMDALKRPRILFARSQGAAYLHNHYPERYVLKISSLCHDLCLQRTNGRVLPAQWKLLPPSKRSCSDSSEGLNVDAGAQSWHQRHPFADGGSATSFFRLFTMPNMRRKTFICYYLWFRWCNPSPSPSSFKLC